jgi:hypothetical protein
VILLPLVSFSADGLVAIIRYIRHQFGSHDPPTTMAKAQAIDLSVQFLLFWLPFLVLLGWWTDKPLSLLFGESAFLASVLFLFLFFLFFHLCGPTWEMGGSVRIFSTLAWRFHSFTLCLHSFDTLFRPSMLRHPISISNRVIFESSIRYAITNASCSPPVLCSSKRQISLRWRSSSEHAS